MRKIIIYMSFVGIIGIFFLLIYSVNNDAEKPFFSVLENNNINTLRQGEVLYYGSLTCPACQEYSKVLREIQKEKNIKIYYWDAMNFEVVDMAAKIKVYNTPTTIMKSKDGAYKIFEGYMNKEEVERFLDGKSQEDTVSNHSEFFLSKDENIMYHYLDSMLVNNFIKKYQDKERLIVYFGRPTCSDCKGFEKFFIKQIKEFSLEDKIKYINVESLHCDKKVWKEFKGKFKIEGTPTLAIYDNGKLVSKLDFEEMKGFTSDDLTEWLNNNVE